MTGCGTVKIGIAVTLLAATAWAAGGTAEEQLSALKAVAAAKIDFAQAVRKVLADQPAGAKAVEVKLTMKGEQAVYKIEVVVDQEFIEVNVDAITGDVQETKKKPALAALWTFDRDKTGSLPEGWRIAETNPSTKLATWKVEADPLGPDKGHVLALTETANVRRTYNLAIADKPAFKDLDIEVKLQAISGKEDQGGGPIWRCKDENNYYVCRLNPLESNYRLYYAKDGKRKQLKSADVENKAGQWYTVRVRMVGARIECYLDGKKLLEAEDSTFTEAGKVGLWTKADAASMFDDMAVMAVSVERPATKTAPATGSEHQ